MVSDYGAFLVAIVFAHDVSLMFLPIVGAFFYDAKGSLLQRLRKERCANKGQEEQNSVNNFRQVQANTKRREEDLSSTG